MSARSRAAPWFGRRPFIRLALDDVAWQTVETILPGAKWFAPSQPVAFAMELTHETHAPVAFAMELTHETHADGTLSARFVSEVRS